MRVRVRVRAMLIVPQPAEVQSYSRSKPAETPYYHNGTQNVIHRTDTRIEKKEKCSKTNENSQKAISR